MSGSNIINQKSSSANAPCPTCGKNIRIVIHQEAKIVVCPSCASILYYSPEGLKAQSAFKRIAAPLLPLGSKGKFNNITYEIVGYAACREYKTIYTWNEYTLFNPEHGYTFLTEFDGHWNFITESTIIPSVTARSFILGAEVYRIYNDYKSSVDTACGEFPWNILQKERTRVEEFISPPNMLIKETSPEEITWYKGQYISSKEIKKAFQLDIYMPRKVGVGANQGSDFHKVIDGIKKITFAAVAVLWVLQIGFVSFAKEKEVFSQEFYLQDSIIDRGSFVTPSFKLESNFSGKANLEFHLKAPVDNNWMEWAITLVNDATGEEYYFEQGIEYYHGVDWTEGSDSETKVLSSIPDGLYHLNITYYQDRFGLTAHSFNMSVVRDAANWTNLFIILTVMIAFPLILYLRNNYFEYQRWQKSNFSPYN